MIPAIIVVEILYIAVERVHEDFFYARRGQCPSNRVA